jgi:hypothetical protein
VFQATRANYMQRRDFVKGIGENCFGVLFALQCQKWDLNPHERKLTTP